MDVKLLLGFSPYVVIVIIAALSVFWFHRPPTSRGNSERSNSTDDEAEASPPSTPSPPGREDGFQYDVFLSFRGTDTRLTFANLLYEALKDKGVVTFIDSEKLEKGQRVEELFKCIERSQIFVPIFSKGYADSQWCLKEIAKMVECKRLIVPLFIDVEPRDVGHQTGPFEPAFKRYHKKIEKKEVSRWRGALKKAGKVSGYTLATTSGYEGKLIQVITKRILSEVNKGPLFVAKHQVGLDSRMAELMEVLDVEAQNDVKMVGIHGMGGIGKTTLAMAVYNQIFSSFDACSFIANVRHDDVKNQSLRLVSLQKQLLNDVFGDDDEVINNTNDGISKIRKRIAAKKVLVVLDDVDDESQLEALAGATDWFCLGSRIIITSRNKKVLRAPRVKENGVYELKGLDAIQSVQLFSWHAFGKEEPDVEFANLSNDVASTAAGLPLALVIFGSHFFDLKTVKEWKDMLEKLKGNQDKDIHEKLRISFDALDANEQEVFLDIACFFIGRGREDATVMWEDRKFSPNITIKVLMHKSLVSINGDKGEFEMHDHIRDMGRQIVQFKRTQVGQIVQSKRIKVGKRSRLWKDDEALDVLQNNKGTEHIEAIQLLWERHDKLMYVDTKPFVAMSQLEVLRLGNVRLEGEFGYLPKSLRWLQWILNDMDQLPDGFQLENIVVLDLSYSSITQLWGQDGTAVTKVLDKLKVLRLAFCSSLAVCPNFTSMPHLGKLDFGNCPRMSELDRSIGHLKCLTHLSLTYCRSLEKLPTEVWQLTSLEELNLSYCTQLTALPSKSTDSKSWKLLLLDKLKVLNLSNCSNLTICPDFSRMPHLEELDFEHCESMHDLDASIGLLKGLTRLNLRHCGSLKELPPEVWRPISLEKLDLSYCSQITTLPSQMEDSSSSKLLLLDRLEVLNLSNCEKLTKCPNLGSMPHLKELCFEGCRRMTQLDPSLGHLKSLTHLKLTGWISELPQEVWQLTSLEHLCLNHCIQITTLTSQSGDLNSLNQHLFGKLKVLGLNDCENLTTCPDFRSMPHLEALDLGCCKKLTELHPSIGHLKRLMSLCLPGCVSLKELPKEVCQLTLLKNLNLMQCYQITTLPSQLGDLTSLKSLLLGRTGITTMPEGVRHMKQLNILSVGRCSMLKEMPEWICSLLYLQQLDFSWCESLASLPDSLGNLRRLSLLDLRGTDIEELPDSIVSLEQLGMLTVAGCKRLKFLPASASIGSMLLTRHEMSSASNDEGPSQRQHYSLLQLPHSLFKLDATGCYELERIANVSNAQVLTQLDLSGCQKLVDIPGIEQLKSLQMLKLGGCRSLDHDLLRERLEEANCELFDWSIPGSLGESPDARSLSFFLPVRWDTGRLFLKLDDNGLDSIDVDLDIRKNGGQLLFQTTIQPRLWRPNDEFDRTVVPEMELSKYIEPMSYSDPQRKMIMMSVSIPGRLLLDGYCSSHLFGLYYDIGGRPDGQPTASVWENFGGPFHRYEGPVVVLHLNFGSIS